MLESIGHRLITVEPPYPEPPPGASKGELAGAIAKQVGRNIMNIPAQLLGTPQAALEASEAWRQGDRSPENAGTVAMSSMLGGVKLGRGGNVPGKMQAPPGEPVGRGPAIAPVSVEPATPAPPVAEVPPPPPGFEPVKTGLGTESMRAYREMANQPQAHLEPRPRGTAADGEYKLGEPEQFGQRQVFKITAPDGRVGEVRIKIDGDTAHITTIGIPGEANTIGPAGMRSLLQQFREQYPEVKRITGVRTTGARSKAGGENFADTPAEVSLPPRDLGAAASTIEEPRTPVTKPEVVAVADDLNRLRQSGVADRAEISQRMEATPPEFKSPELQERFYHYIEEPKSFNRPGSNLTINPAEKALFDQHIQPMRDELSALYNKVKQYGGEDMVADPTYVHRIAKGHAPVYDTLSGDAADPITGTGRGLNRTTSALQGRKFFALEDESGARFVVSKGDGASTIWTKGKPTQMTTELELRPGTEVELGGKRFDVKQATTQEIEANSDVRYHKNAAVNTADALVRMREVARNIEALEKFKTDLTATGRARPVVNGRAPAGFEETKIPQLRGTAFEPKLAHAFNDFYKPGLEGLESLRKINQFATSSIFWNPLPHIENVAAHWFTGRGWDWIRPGPMKNFASDSGRAIRSVVTQGPEYQRLLREGSGLVYGAVKNADFYQAMGKRFGMDIEQNWGAWKPTFDKLGLKTPYEATAWWYGKMRNVLWAANDMFMVHRVLELERKGLSVREAIKEAEKHIPNYRIPSEVVGSRQFSRILQEPALTIFSRYHYGMWKSYMNMVADMAKGAPKEKVEALGNLAALGVLMYAIYPAIDTALQMVTGDEKAKKLRRGSTSIPEWSKELYQGDLAFPQFLSNAITMAPATKEGMQQFTGKNWFTGQDLGNVVPRIEHATKALISPYNTAAQMTDSRPGTRSAGRTAFDTVVGAKNTSERTTQGRERAKMYREKADARAYERPTGPITKGYKAAKDYVSKAYQDYKGP